MCVRDRFYSPLQLFVFFILAVVPQEVTQCNQHCADTVSYTHLDVYKRQAQWDEAYKKVQVLSDDWHAYKKTAIFFLDTQTINDIDYAMAKSVKYVKAEDVSNASGELFAMVEQLTFLCSNDEVNWGNVF